ncbi:phage major capsid protein [Isoptericola sp. NPDC056578]|uniref:phage major capsid protein n=1 Tax=Isoptericola sp. NPDC056578 TaxID=3345870 RepID=UPI0036886FFD
MAIQTTVTAQPGWAPDVTYIPAAEAIPDALVLKASTVAGQVEGDSPMVRVLWVDGAEAQSVPEGEEIPEGEPELAETLVVTHRVSVLVPVSLELARQTGRAQLLADSLRRAVIRQADHAFINRPEGTPPAGIIHGIPQVADPVVANLDPLADAVAGIEAAEGIPSIILAAPGAWADLRKVKTGADSAESLLGAGTDDAAPRLLGIPVLRTPAVPSGKLLVLDKRAIVSAVGDVEVATSEHVYFKRNALAQRVTFRFGQALMHPERTALVTVGAADTGGSGE